MSDTQKAGRIQFEKQADGGMRFFTEGEAASYEKTYDASEFARLDTMSHGVVSEKSAAQREIDELKAKRQTIVERVISGKTRFIKNLTWSQTVEIGLQVARDSGGSLDIREHGVMRAFMVTLLSECLVSGKDNDAPYFSREDAVEYVDNEDVPTLGAHFDAITEINKGLLPKGLTANPTMGQE